MIDIPVLYEDESLLVLQKPANIMVHTDGRNEDATIVDWVRQSRPDMVGVGENMVLQNGDTIDRPGIVHRLDRETSGVILLAKTQEAFAYIKKQFQDRSIHKTYHAVAWGELHEQTGTIDRPIGRSKKDFRLWSATQTAGGNMRSAVTRWTLLATQDGFSYLVVEPKTGRTHQIRVHMKAIGHPLVCDTRYAPKKEKALGFERLALHAHSIQFTHPNGTQLEVEAPFPEDFVHARTLLHVV